MEIIFKKPVVDIDALSLCIESQHQTHARNTLESAVRTIAMHMSPAKYEGFVRDEIINVALKDIRDCPIPERPRTPMQAYHHVCTIVKDIMDRKYNNKEKQVVAGTKFLDLIKQLGIGESLLISPNGLQVDFTLIRKSERGGANRIFKSSSTMPADHHCDVERIQDMVAFLQKRISESEGA